MLGIDGNSHNFAGRVHNAGQQKCRVAQGFERWQIVMRQPAHMGAGWFMCQNQRIRLAAMDQRQRHAGIAGVKQAALPFDVVPMIGVIVRRQIFNSARHEVSDDRIKWNAAASDQNPCLTRGTERRFQPAFAHFRINGEAGVHFTNGAIGANGQTSLAGSLYAVGNGIGHGRDPHIVQLAAIGTRGVNQISFVT